MDFKKYSSYDNRGMTLESDLNITNEYYLENNIACIYKKPTPIQVVKVLNNSIKEAYFRTPSTTDYNGIYKGIYIDFEAKETNLDYFPLKNLHKHQIKHLETIMDMKGFSFLIIRFTKYNKTFLLKTEKLLKFINSNNRKSIPYAYFINEVHMININYNPRLDYLKIVDLILEGD